MGILIYQGANYRLSLHLSEQLKQVFVDDFIVLKFSNEIQINFSELNKLYQAAIIEADLDTLVEADAKAQNMKNQFNNISRNFETNDPLFIRLVESFDDYTKLTSKHTSAVLLGSLHYNQTLKGYDQIGRLRQEYEKYQSAFFEQSYASFEQKLQYIQLEGRFLVKFGLVLGIILTAILGLFSFFVIRHLTQAFNRVVFVAQRIAGGDFDIQIEANANDETGMMMNSLRAMRQSLVQQRFDNLQREHTKDFLSGLNARMQGDPKRADLLFKLLSFIGNEMGIQTVRFYVWQDDQLLLDQDLMVKVTETDKVTDYCDSYLGQVAKGVEIRVLNQVHALAMDKSDAQALMLVPIFNDHIKMGLIELKSVRAFSKDHLLLMQKAIHPIAIGLTSAQARDQLAVILVQTQAQAAELRKQRKELEISDRYKSQFLSSMSHELRTPLNSILILSEALLSNPNQTLSQQELKHAQVIHNAGSDLLTLINDILDLSKIEEGKMEINWEQFNIRSLAENIYHAFELQAKNKGLDYQVIVDNSVPPTLCSDSYRLKQILKNFISNALKFTEVGSITVKFSHKIDEHKHWYLYISVIDTGLGIAPSKQFDVFEPFQQLDGTTSRKFGGTGLGLSISKELAALIQSSIYLESEGKNKGACFTIKVPIYPEIALYTAINKTDLSTPIPQKKHQLSHASQAVLVIEDNPVLTQTMSVFFNKNNLETKIAANGKEAISLINNKQFGCIVMDLHLPDLDGKTLCKKIRSNSKYKNTPIIVFTAEELTEEAKAKLLIDADYVILKSPSAIKDIASLITSIFSSSQFKPQTKNDFIHVNNQEKKILLVDDDERNLYSLSMFLKTNGYQVNEVESGRACLHWLKKHAVDVILLDIMMPEMDGYEVMLALKSRAKTAAIPIVAVTAKATIEHKQQCIDSGASAYLSKPVDTNALLATLNEILIEQTEKEC